VHEPGGIAKIRATFVENPLVAIVKIANAIERLATGGRKLDLFWCYPGTGDNCAECQAQSSKCTRALRMDSAARSRIRLTKT
jgi:hypothetical protein